MENEILEPPLYFSSDHIFDICFHPNKNIIASAEITGNVKM